MRFWHYTKAITLPKILTSGEIKLDELAIDFGQKPATWVSTNHEWENIATKGTFDRYGNDYLFTANQQCIVWGLGRIQINPSINFISWYEFGLTSGIDQELWIRMTDYGRERHANPDEWYASYSPIFSGDFLSVEMNIDGEWIGCKDLVMIDKFVNHGMEINRAIFNKEVVLSGMSYDMCFEKLGRVA